MTMELERFSKERMQKIVDIWFSQFDDSATFVTESLRGNSDYLHSFSLIAVDREVTV